MTNIERDQCIADSHDILMRIKPLVLAHEEEMRGSAGLLAQVAIIHAAQNACLENQKGQPPRIANWVAIAALIVAIFAIFMGS